MECAGGKFIICNLVKPTALAWFPDWIARTSAMQDVVNLRRYRCDEDGCDRQAYYNYPGVSGAKAKFCSTHKLPTMINVRHRLCENEGCGKTPTYSVQGSRPRYQSCHVHRPCLVCFVRIWQHVLCDQGRSPHGNVYRAEGRVGV